MEQAAVFKSVFPIGDTDIHNLPVTDVAASVAYYSDVFGFSVRSQAGDSATSATLYRDDVEIGIATTGADPEQASCYFGVSDVESAHHELQAKGADVSAIAEQEHDGKSYRVFFARDKDGICFCIGQPAL